MGKKLRNFRPERNLSGRPVHTAPFVIEKLGFEMVGTLAKWWGHGQIRSRLLSLEVDFCASSPTDRDLRVVGEGQPRRHLGPLAWPLAKEMTTSDR